MSGKDLACKGFKEILLFSGMIFVIVTQPQTPYEKKNILKNTEFCMQNIKKNLMRKYIFQQYYLVTYYKLTNACSKKNVFSEGNILCEELFNYISGD